MLKQTNLTPQIEELEAKTLHKLQLQYDLEKNNSLNWFKILSRKIRQDIIKSYEIK